MLPQPQQRLHAAWWRLVLQQQLLRLLQPAERQSQCSQQGQGRCWKRPVCVCACVCAYVYVLYTCACVCERVPNSTCVHVCVRLCEYACVRMCMHACVCLCVCTCISRATCCYSSYKVKKTLGPPVSTATRILKAQPLQIMWIVLQTVVAIMQMFTAFWKRRTKRADLSMYE